MILLLAALLTSAHALQYMGVNMAGADFGEGNLPGTHGKDYIWDVSSTSYFVQKGMNNMRLGFRWERLQRTLNGAFDSEEQARLVDSVAKIRAAGASVIIEPHNYARYHGQIISPKLNAEFVDLWKRLATMFKGDQGVIFELINEPQGLPSITEWVKTCNQAIAAIRSTGAKNLILVPGSRWTGGWSWMRADGAGPSNGAALLAITDSANNYGFTIHQYFDSDYSGKSTVCTHTASVLKDVTASLKQNNKRGYLTEFAGANNPECKKTIEGLLTYLEDNDDVWKGWNWWSAGAWWGDYMYSIQPKSGGVDRPQMDWVEPFLKKAPAPAPTPAPAPKPAPAPAPTPAPAPKPAPAPATQRWVCGKCKLEITYE